MKSNPILESIEKEQLRTDLPKLAVGDTVLFTNDYGVTFGPHEVLGFCRPDSFLCPHRYPEDEDCGIVFSDNDAYWFPDRPGQLTLVQKGGADV